MTLACFAVEHLIVKKTEDYLDYTPESIMQGQLAALAAVMLIDSRTEIYQMKLVADGTEYTFSGSEITPAYKQIMEAMSKAKEIDFWIDYLYFWNSGWRMYDLLGPFVLTNYFKKRYDKDKDHLNVFYCSWHCEGKDKVPSKLVAFGTRNGKTYSGTVKRKKVPSIPEGIWKAEIQSPTNIKTDVSFDITNYKERLKTYRELADFGFATTFNNSIGSLGFYPSKKAVIQTPEQREHYKEHCNHLMSLVPAEVRSSLSASFLDTSKENPRLMTIEHDGKDLIIKVAEIR